MSVRRFFFAQNRHHVTQSFDIAETCTVSSCGSFQDQAPHALHVNKGRDAWSTVLYSAANSAHAQNRKLSIRDGGETFWPAVALYLFCWGFSLYFLLR